MPKSQRQPAFDTLKCLMVFLVIVGQLLERIPAMWGHTVYTLIYTFHVPMLFFISGCFARLDRKKLFSDILYPYVLFQVLYLFADAVLLNDTGWREAVLQFTTPYWHLWHLLVLLFYTMLPPPLENSTPRMRMTIVMASMAASALAGYDSTVGYYMSLSRFFTFLPFYVTGYFFGHGQAAGFPSKKKTVLVSALASVGGTALIYGKLTPAILYGSVGYQQAGYGPLIKSILTLTGFGWIALLITITPKKPIPVISTLGRKTLPIYLMHGLCVRLIGKYKMFFLQPQPNYKTVNMVLVLFYAAGMVLLFGNSLFAGVFARLCTGRWLLKLLSGKNATKYKIADETNEHEAIE